MSEDPTEKLPQEASFEARVLAEFAAMRGELTAFRSEVAGEFAAVRSEVASELAAFRSEVAGEFAAVRNEVAGGFAAVRSEVASEFGIIRNEIAAIRDEQAAIRTDIARLDSRQQKFGERLMALEEKVDSRLSETRPIWEAVQLAIKRLDLKFDTVLSDLCDVRTDSKILARRLMELEAR